MGPNRFMDGLDRMERSKSSGRRSRLRVRPRQWARECCTPGAAPIEWIVFAPPSCYRPRPTLAEMPDAEGRAPGSEHSEHPGLACTGVYCAEKSAAGD